MVAFSRYLLIKTNFSNVLFRRFYSAFRISYGEFKEYLFGDLRGPKSGSIKGL